MDIDLIRISSCFNRLVFGAELKFQRPRGSLVGLSSNCCS
jgi:hypothetical protein